MDEEFQKYEQIEAYLANKMPEQERIIFDEKIKNDLTFAQDVELHALANDFVIEQRLLSVEQKIKALKPIKTSIFSVKSALLGFTFLSLTLSLLFIFSEKKEIKEENEKTEIIQKESVAIEKISDKNEEISDIKKIISPEVVQEQEAQIPIKKISKIQENIIDTIMIIDEEKKIKQNQIVKIKQSPKNIVLEQDKNKEIIVVNEENPCEKNQVIFTVKSTDACENVADGKVIISTVEGGKKPYLYSINKKDYYSFDEFGGLLHGDYVVTIKDANKCIYQKAITIQSKNCKEDKEYLLNPQFSVWEIPFNKEKNAFLKIMNKKGLTVYKQELEINSYHEWNGQTQENRLLPLGLYVYLIEYEDGEIEQGYITLVR